MPYLFLLLSLLSSLIIALLLKHSENRGRDTQVIIAANYIIAGTLGFILTHKSGASWPVYGLGIVLGLFFFIAFVIFSRAIKKCGIAGAVTMGRLSLAIPVLLSIFLAGEKPPMLDILCLGAIFFIILSWEGKIGKISPLLLLLFLLFGSIDAAMKFFKLEFPGMDDSFFLVIVFFSAMCWSWLYMLIKRKKISPRDFFTGLLLGAPNFFSSYFLLKALFHIPGYIVFPFINTGLIIFSAILGYLVFKEKLDAKKVFLITLGAVAVFFLTT